MNDKRHDHGFDGFDTEDFVGGVLGRTSGHACTKAVTQLSDLMDDRLAGLDRQLVQAHLEHCAGCRQLAVTLGWLTPLLPAMAEIEPGPEFLAGVLNRTTLAPRPVVLGEHPAGLAGLMDRLGRWWQRQILRPDFGLQVAYVATVVLVLLTATPYSPWRQVPKHALEVVTAGPQTAPLIGPVMTQAGDWIEGKSAAAVNTGHGQIASRWQQAQAGLDTRNSRTALSRSELQTHWQVMVNQVRAREVSGAGYEFLALLRVGNVVWTQWWHGPEPAGGP